MAESSPALLDEPLSLGTGLVVAGSAQLVALKLQRQAHPQTGHLTAHEGQQRQKDNTQTHTNTDTHYKCHASMQQSLNRSGNLSHTDEGASYHKDPGTVGVGGVVAGEEGRLQCPLDACHSLQLYSGVAFWER